MVGPTPSAAASASSEASRTAAIEPNSVASARAAVGPTWRIDSPTSTRHSGTCFAWSRLASSRSPLAESTRPSVARSASVFLAARVNRSVVSSLASSRSNTSPSSWITFARPQGVRRLRPEPLDVEGAAAGDVEDPVEQLGRAGVVVGAAQVLVALLLLHQRRAARRALGGHHPLPQALRAQPEHRPDDLGDDVAGLAQDHRVAGAHVLARDLVAVVQGRPLDRRAGHPGRLHHAERRHPAGAAGVDLDARPAWR